MTLEEMMEVTEYAVEANSFEKSHLWEQIIISLIAGVFILVYSLYITVQEIKHERTTTKT